MAEHVTGYYCIKNHGHVVVVKRAVATLREKDSKISALNLAGQRDPRFIGLEDPEITVITQERTPASYIMGFTITKGHFVYGTLSLDGLTVTGTCSHCHEPMPSYVSMLKAGRYECPHCNALLTEVESNPLNNIAVGMALADPDKNKHEVSLTPIFKLPFGFPVPAAVHVSQIKPEIMTETNEFNTKTIEPYAKALEG